MTGPFKVAAVQMVSEPTVAANLDAAGALVAEAAALGARLAVLPEWFCLMGRTERDKLPIRERDGDGPIQSFLAGAAAKHGVWVIAGTVPLFARDPERVRNASLVYDAAGRRVARYDKIHLFDFTGEGEQYRESRTIEAGDAPVAVDSPFGRLALSICYDVRFPELYRRLAPMDAHHRPFRFHRDDRGGPLGDPAARPGGREPGVGDRAGAGGRARERAPDPRPFDDRRPLGQGSGEPPPRPRGCGGGNRSQRY